MKPFHILIASLLTLTPTAAFAQAAETDRLAAVAWILGDWDGIGEGQPGTAATSRKAVRVVNGRYIQVTSRSVYPKQEKNRAGETHASIDLWSFDRQRKLLMLRQFDSLGFVSTYRQDVAASTGGRIVMVSEHLENVPPGLKSRYTYTYRAPNEYQELFELDMGKGLQPYVTSRLLRAE